MSRRRRTFSGAFKAKVALAAVRGDKTTAELTSQFAVHGNQVSAWKKQLLEGAPGLLADGRTCEATGAAEEELYEQIGRLKMEVEWLKKNPVVRSLAVIRRYSQVVGRLRDRFLLFCRRRGLAGRSVRSREAFRGSGAVQGTSEVPHATLPSQV